MGWLAVLLMLHILGVVVWVGGMFFAYVCLRPVLVELLEPPERLRVWRGIFARFLAWVRWAAGLIVASGIGMFMLHGFTRSPLNWHLMMATGLVMIAVFVFVDRLLYPALDRAVESGDWKTAGLVLARIRQAVGVNLILGALTIAIATAGNFLY